MTNSTALLLGRPTLTVDVLIPNKNGDLLVIRRGHDFFQWMWCFPGGYVDPAETVETASIREVKEETGLQVCIARVVDIYSALGRDPRRDYISIILQARPVDAEPQVTEEATEWKWAPMNEKLEMAFDHARIRNNYSGSVAGTHGVVLA